VITATVLPSGNLKLTVDKDHAGDFAELVNDSSYESEVLDVAMEHYWTNGSYYPFEPGMGGPSIGLTDAPAIAESMEHDEDGDPYIVGRLWWFPQYESTSCIDQLAKTGKCIFTLAP